ncbi:peptidyl-prolyl cis-trans FKBP-type [Micractinium conductrix]|uniref:peptidylprolyl isomerase n=1 Tax=Micractinium conductrix TaxID=554055 RepID=A0A2P6VJT7_9CHLO|nr:peptidyl-prolyl cis-trans FKBP-type [Micractinium conductrix]|eukprot:PSC74353.1 peptidyl-prolyl cis-trans FKBP-type [Micractinium conductrix]
MMTTILCVAPASAAACTVRRRRAASAAAWRCRLPAPQLCSSGSSSGASSGGATSSTAQRGARGWQLAAADTEAAAAAPLPVVAGVGDIVTLNWRCYNEDGELLESSDQSEEPTTFEVGAGDIVGNRLFEAFDEAVRGLAVGDVTRIQAEGGEWKEELMFRVPRGHPEVERMEGRYKNQGGVKEGLLVELSNGGMALVVQAGEEAVVLDANNMLAGMTLIFDLELADLDRPAAR